MAGSLSLKLNPYNPDRIEDPNKKWTREQKSILDAQHSQIKEVKDAAFRMMRESSLGQKAETLGFGSFGMIRGPGKVSEGIRKEIREKMKQEFQARGKPDNWFDEVFGGVQFRGESSNRIIPSGKTYQDIGAKPGGTPSGISLSGSPEWASRFAKGKRTFTSEGMRSTKSIQRSLPLYGDKPSNVLIKGWKGSEHEQLIREILKESTDSVEISRRLGEKGFKGIAYPTTKTGEFEVKMFNPKDILSVDKRSVKDPTIQRYMKIFGSKKLKKHQYNAPSKKAKSDIYTILGE
jgi:hypothetical protein